ncbi:MAG: HAD family hydrolase [Gemmatimonadota bacterium]
MNSASSAAVLMEFDGVLADTRDLRIASVAEVLALSGVELDRRDIADLVEGQPVGEGIREVARVRLPPQDETALDLLALRVERVYLESLAKGVVLVEGAGGAVEHLAATARLGIVTRLRRSDVAQLVDLAGLSDLFSFIIGAADARPHKPSPAPYRAALGRLARASTPIRPANVIALEDCLSGIRSAHAAGLRCVAVGQLPAHVAMEADGYTAAITGHNLESLDRLALESE